MQQIELVTHKACPYAQRVAIVLLEKKVKFTSIYVDLANKPQWFLDIAPVGRIPLLRVGDQVLFESAIINEYLDEIYPPKMHDEDPIQRAKQRGWVAYSEEIIPHTARLVFAEDLQSFLEQKQACEFKLAKVASAITQKPFFGGSRFSLIDAAFAPIFIRLAELQKYATEEVVSLSPAMKNWSDHILAHPSVQNMLPPDFAQEFVTWVKRSKSYFNQQWL